MSKLRGSVGTTGKHEGNRKVPLPPHNKNAPSGLRRPEVQSFQDLPGHTLLTIDRELVQEAREEGPLVDGAEAWHILQHKRLRP